MSRLRILVVVALAGMALSAAGAEVMSVQVKQGELRDSPSYLGTVLAPLNYGDRVQILEQQGPWYKATAPDGNTTGWIHSSALTKKKVTLHAGEDVNKAASSGELALAGKGFNPSVEAEFKAQNKNLNYTWVDKMEGIKIPARKILAFLHDGGLVTPKAGAR